MVIRLRALFLPLACLASTVATTAQTGQEDQLLGITEGLYAGQTWPHIEAPGGNPFVPSMQDPFFPDAESVTDLKRRLGKALFWDEQVSSDNTMACGTCHSFAAGGTDARGTFPHAQGLDGALGMVPQDVQGNFYTEPGLQFDRRVTFRNPPTVIGAAFFEKVLWDGSAGPDFHDEQGVVLLEDAAALEAQAVLPAINATEMGHDGRTWSDVVAKLASARPLALATNVPSDLAADTAPGITYDQLFDQAFGGTEGVTRERFAMALATYERTLVPNEAPIDMGPLSAKAQAGFDKAAACFACHGFSGGAALGGSGGFLDPMSSLMSDGQTDHPTPLPSTQPMGTATPITKTPTLRNVALRKSWFHSGQVKSMSRLIDLYRGVGGTFNNVFLPPINTNPPTTAQVQALFDALTDPRVARELAPFDRPTLYSEQFLFGDNEYGAGSTTQGGAVPDILAHVPYLTGDPHFKIGVLGGPANGTGLLAVSLGDAPGPLVWVDFGANLVDTFTVPLGPDGTGTFHAGAAGLPVGGPGTTFYAQWVVFQGDQLVGRSNAASFVVK